MAITSKVWNKLGKKDKTLLKRIGLKPSILKKPPPFKGKSLEPYYLKITVNCSLCNSKPVQYFHMIPSEDRSSLQARGVTKEEAKSHKCQEKEVHSSTCSECYKVLTKKWKKEELVKALIKAYPLASIGGFKG